MKQKCQYCMYFKKLTSGSPGRNHGKCNYIHDIILILPEWAIGKNSTLEKNGTECEAFEHR